MATTTSKLDTLRRKLAEARQAEREIAAKPDQLRAEFEALGDQLVEHALPIDGSAPPAGSEAGKLWRQRHDVQTKIGGPWSERLQRARLETQRREAELGRFVADHLGELVGEIEPDAEAAARNIDNAITELLGALDGWHEVAGRVTSLIRHAPALDGRDLPRLAADVLRSDLRRLAASPTPRPLPRSLYAEEQAEETITGVPAGTVADLTGE
jgi:hypothetical protein